MTFSNAHKGVGRIFTGEILTLIGELPMFTAMISALFAVALMNDAPDKRDDFTGDLITLMIITAVGLVFSIIGLIFKIVGAIRSGRDQKSFMIALVGLFAEVAVTLSSMIVTENSTWSTVLSTVGDIAGLVSTFFIIRGIRNLAIELDDEIMEIKGENLFKLYFIIVLFKASTFFVERMFSDKVGMTISIVLAVLSVVLLVIQYVLYLRYLNKARKMLLKEKPEDDEE